MPRYFYGRSVKSNRVTASTARNFRSLVQHHLEGIIRLAYTQAEYAALETKEQKLNAKDTLYLVASTYEADDTERNAPKPSSVCNLLFLDLDEEDDGSCPAAVFVRNPGVLVKKLAPFNFAAYTTASSTPQKPRMRVVMDAVDIPLAFYPAAVKTLAKMLGVATYDPRSLVPNQPMICPTLFLGQDEDMEHPLFATEFKGRSFNQSDIREFSETRAKPIAGLPLDDGDDDGLEFLRAPLMGLTLEKIQSALDHLDPNMPYPQWFEVAACLRHQFSGSEEEAEAAYEVFDSWSSKATREGGYAGPDNTLEEWNDAKPQPRGRLPVTIRTLIKRASDAGWSAGEVKEECFDAVMDWIAHNATTRHDLTHGALAKVAGLPLLTATEEDLLLSAIKTQLWETRKERITTTSLRKDLRKIQSARDRVKADTTHVPEQPWTKGWCYVATEEQFFRHSSHQKRSGEAINSAFGRYLLPTEEQLEKSGKEINEGTLNTPLFLPKDYLLHHRQCLVVDDYDYDPTNPKDIYTEDGEGVRLVNTYRASYPKPDPARAKRAGAAIKKHLDNLIAEPEYRTVILDYIAYVVQFPGRKIRWCPLIQGAEGCGKTLMARLLESVLGEDNVALVNNDGIKSQWNDWAFGHQIVVIPETYVAGRAKMDTMNRLKDLVTDERVGINKRNNSFRTAVNRTNYIMFTNHHDALVLMSGSRRYFVLKSPLQTEAQVKALGASYFEELFDTIRNNGAGMRSFFETWEISDEFTPDGHAPRTKYLDEMIEDGADEATSILRSIIAEGTSPLIQKDLVASITLKTMLEIEGLRPSNQAVAAVLRGENFIKASTGKGVVIDGVKEHLWVKAGHLRGVDVVELARERFENKYTTEEDWI